MTVSSQNGVTLVLGPPNSGKRGMALDWWQERLDSKPLVVMPTAPDALEISCELGERMHGLVGHSQALTFTGLARLITQGSVRIIGELERMILIQGLLKTLQLDSLETVGHLPGVAATAGRLLQELGESGKKPAEIRGLLERWSVSEPSSASLGPDIGRLLMAYQQEMASRGLVDQGTLVQEASESAAGWRRPVTFCGFTSFTRGQKALVETLSKETEILVTLDYDREKDVGLCARSEMEWWVAHAGRVQDVGPQAQTYASEAVAYLERHLLGGAESGAVTREAEEEGVRFLLSSGMRAEAESAAERIAALLRTGFSPGGIAVVVRQVRAWGRLLGDVFDSCGIPYRIDERPGLGETGLGYAFLQVVRGVTSDDAEALLRFLGSPYCELEREAVHDLEARYRRGAGRGVGALVDAADRRAEQTLRQLWDLVPSDGAEGQATASRVDSQTSRSQEIDLGAARALARTMMSAAARGEDVGSGDLEADARAYRALTEALSVVECYVGARTSEEMLRPLTQATVPVPVSGRAEAVQIISAQRARARRFDAVFVLGLVEGEFPGVADEPSLLTAAQRGSLDSLSGGLLASESSGERPLFIGAATRAWRLLYLSARDAEDDGGEAMPSRFWTEAKTLLGAKDDDCRRRTLADQVFSAESAPSMRHYLRACVAEGRESGQHEPYGGPWRRDSGGLVAPEVIAELEATQTFSPSGLESYVTCPFAWFVDRVIGRQEFEAEMDGRVVGELVHTVLGKCYQSLSADGLLPLSDETVSEAESRADALIEEVVQGPGCPGTTAERRLAAYRLREMVRRLFRAEADAGGSLVFEEAEVQVGGAEGVDIGGLRIHGRVDRIDRLDTGSDDRSLFVFDYKSGAVPKSAALGTGEALQLPLYLLALGAEREETEIVGGAYLSLSQGSLTGVISSRRQASLGTRAGKCRVLDPDEWRTLADSTLGTAEQAAEGIRKGDVAPRPDRVCPDWCDLGPVCRARVGGRRP